MSDNYGEAIVEERDCHLGYFLHSNFSKHLSLCDPPLFRFCTNRNRAFRFQVVYFFYGTGINL